MPRGTQILYRGSPNPKNPNENSKTFQSSKEPLGDASLSSLEPSLQGQTNRVPVSPGHLRPPLSAHAQACSALREENQRVKRQRLRAVAGDARPGPGRRGRAPGTRSLDSPRARRASEVASAWWQVSKTGELDSGGDVPVTGNPSRDLRTWVSTPTWCLGRGKKKDLKTHLTLTHGDDES